VIEASGLVANVYPDAAGVVVVADAAATDVTLNVRDAADLVNYPAGLLLLPDDTLAAYESPPVFGPAADPDVVTLTAGLPADLTAEIALDLYDVGRQERVVVERASELDEWQLRRPVRRVPKLDLAFARPGTLSAASLAPGTALASVIDPDDPMWTALVLGIVTPYVELRGAGGASRRIDGGLM
jgi:hypothetical protein